MTRKEFQAIKNDLQRMSKEIKFNAFAMYNIAGELYKDLNWDSINDDKLELQDALRDIMNSLKKVDRYIYNLLGE